MMKNFATNSKVQHFVEKHLLKKLPGLKQCLISGDLLQYEQELQKQIGLLYNNISESMLQEASKELLGKFRKPARQENLKRLRERKTAVQIATGHVVKVYSIYANEIPPGYKKSRHLLANHWSIISNSSVSHIDKVCMSNALCLPIALQINYLGVLGCIRVLAGPEN